MREKEKTTSKGWRVGDRVAFIGFGVVPVAAVILEVGDDDHCRLRFDDDSVGVHNLASPYINWRRLKSKKITLFKESKR